MAPVGIGFVAFGRGHRCDDRERRIAVLVRRFLQKGPRGIERVHGAQHIEPEVGLPRRGARPLRHRAGVGDEGVDAAQFFARFDDPFLQRVAVGDVDRRAGCLYAFCFER